MIGVDPCDDARMDVSLLKQGDQPPHTPIPLLNMIAANDQEVQATDVE